MAALRGGREAFWIVRGVALCRVASPPSTGCAHLAALRRHAAKRDVAMALTMVGLDGQSALQKRIGPWGMRDELGARCSTRPQLEEAASHVPPTNGADGGVLHLFGTAEGGGDADR